MKIQLNRNVQVWDLMAGWMHEPDVLKLSCFFFFIEEGKKEMVTAAAAAVNKHDEQVVEDNWRTILVGRDFYELVVIGVGESAHSPTAQW